MPCFRQRRSKFLLAIACLFGLLYFLGDGAGLRGAAVDSWPVRVITGPRVVTEEEWQERAMLVKQAFLHAWSGYERIAWGYDEAKPLDRKKVNK